MDLLQVFRHPAVLSIEHNTNEFTQDNFLASGLLKVPAFLDMLLVGTQKLVRKVLGIQEFVMHLAFVQLVDFVLFLNFKHGEVLQYLVFLQVCGVTVVLLIQSLTQL